MRVAGRKEEDEEEEDVYEQEMRESWLIKFGRNGARASLRFCIWAGRKHKEEGGGNLQSQVLGGY